MSRTENLGPLTTTWTQPATCSSLRVFCPSPDDCSTDFTLAQGLSCTSSQTTSLAVESFPISSGVWEVDSFSLVYYPYSLTVDPNCWPPASSSSSSVYGYQKGFYSPGLVCPEGYTIACQSTSGGSYNWLFDFTLANGETAAGCCPTSYKCGNAGSAQTCIYIASSLDTFRGWCSDQIHTWEPAIIPTSYVTVGSDDSTANTTISQQVIYAPMIRLNWQSSDLPSRTSTYTPAPQTAATTAIPKNRSGLSTGAKAGIGVGVALGAICVIGIVIWLLLRYRRSKKLGHDAQPGEMASGSYRQDKHEMPGQQSWAHELTLDDGWHEGQPGVMHSDSGTAPAPSLPSRSTFELGQ